MTEIDVNRHNELIDPHLEIWGWEIAGYLFLGGVAAGIMVFAALAARRQAEGEASRWVRWLPLAAPVLVSVGMLLLLLDLEAKHHVYRFYMALRVASPMSWGSWLLVLIYPATVLFGLAGLTEGEATRLSIWGPVRVARLGRLGLWVWRWARERTDMLRKVNVVLGLSLGLYTGILLGTLQARPLWSSTLLGPLFLASGLSTGAAFMMLFPLKSGEQHLLRRWDLLAISAEVLFLSLFFVDLMTGGAAAQAQIDRFLGGDLTAPFWALVVVAGLAVPVILELVEARRGLRRTLAAPALILVGGLSLRWLLVFGGQS